MTLDQPYFMQDESWYYFDGNELRYKLTDKAPKEAQESYKEFMELVDVKDIELPSGNKVKVRRTPVKRDELAKIVIHNDGWVTMSGSHVLIGPDGRIKAGAGGRLTGKKFGSKFRDKSFEGTLYHGSLNKGIKELNPNHKGKNRIYEGEEFVFLTDKKNIANTYAREQSEGSHSWTVKLGDKVGSVYTAKVRMKNPLDFRSLSKKDKDFLLSLDGAKENMNRAALEGLIKNKNHKLLRFLAEIKPEDLRRGGYDGFIANMGRGYDGALEYAVINPKQIQIEKEE